MSRGQGEIIPILLKCSAALAVSFAGISYSLLKLGQIRSRRLGKHHHHHHHHRVDSNAKNGEDDGEIRKLKNVVKALMERERNLEMKLLEHYGHKEQQTAVTELQNRLKIKNTEARLFHLKIETLQADKCRLSEQVARHEEFIEELESARCKMKSLKRKLRIDAEQSRDEILKLKQKVKDESNAGMQKLKVLECESEELRKTTIRLELEKAELVRKFTPISEEKERLSREIEKLQSDRCSDVEEVVYLRWLNACLRYELRNYRPPEGKTVARDLGSTMSPRSEEKTKQLILKYANNDGNCFGEDDDLQAIYFDRCPSLQASSDSCDFEETLSAESSSSPRTNRTKKMQFLKKLVKLIRRKADHRYEKRSSSPAGPSRFSGELQKPEAPNEEDADTDFPFLRNGDEPEEDCRSYSDLLCSSYSDHKSDLAKYAKALMNNRAKPRLTHARSFSCS